MPLVARYGAAQSYEPIGGNILIRMQNGAALKQTHWAKTRTTISAEGNVPPGLESLDYAGPLNLKCAARCEITGAGLVYTLPAARRTDPGYTPLGFGWIGDRYVPTALALSTNTATLTALAVATHYRVIWWPEFNVIASPPTIETDLAGAIIRWTLTAEEA